MASRGHVPLAAILDGIPGDRIAAVDTRLRYIAANAAYREDFRRRFGAAVEPGMTVSGSLVDRPDEQARAVDAWCRALAGESFTVEASGAAAGQQRPVTFLFPLDEGGRRVGAASVTRDLAAESRSNESPRHGATDLNRAQAVAKTGSWRLDLLRDELTWSDEIYRMFGLPKGTPFTYQVFLSAVHPEDRALVEGKWRAALAGEPCDVEHRIVVGDEVKWVNHRTELEFDTDGSLRGVFGTVQDISDRRRAGEALRHHAEALSFLSGTATRLLAPAGRAELFEFVAERIHSLAGGAIVSLSEFDVRARRIVIRQLRCTAEERERIMRLMGREPEGMSFDLPGELRSQMLPGELQHLPGGLHQATFARLPLPLCQHVEKELHLGDVFAMACAVDEDILGTVAVLTHEHGALRSKALIESVVNQAALALKRWRTEETLRESEEALREADRRKNEFLAMLSHELRNPLAPIRNSIYVLERSVPGSKQARRAQEVIDRQVRQLTRLTDDLLDVTRIARAKVQLRREPLELGELVRRTVEDHRDDFLRNGVDLRLELAEGPLHVDGDPTRLAQVVGNLLQNAEKFSDRGGRTTVSLATRGERVEVRIRDEGVGIAHGTLAHLFEPFVQADTSLERSRGGLGLGLAVVKGFVEMHGGTVRAESEGLGKGALFVVELPLQPPRPEGTAGAAESVGRRPTRRRVLVVEDNLDAAESLKEALELSGHEVELAHSGPEGIEKARRFRPSVVVCDLGLPGMDGYAVARAIRRNEGPAAPYLVALSGYALQEDLDRSREAGFDEHMAKPPDLEALARLLASK